jgi:hypothetical protein
MAKKNDIKAALENGVIHDAPKEGSEQTTEQETPKEGKTKKVKILRVVCRPEGTFLPNRLYNLEEKLALHLIKTGSAEEAK